MASSSPRKLAVIYNGLWSLKKYLEKTTFFGTSMVYDILRKKSSNPVKNKPKEN